MKKLISNKYGHVAHQKKALLEQKLNKIIILVSIHAYLSITDAFDLNDKRFKRVLSHYKFNHHLTYPYLIYYKCQ